jgi:mRNA interferase MazF
MPASVHAQGDVLLAWLMFSDGQGAKRRPVLVVKDFGDDDLLVVPITSQPARVTTDVVLNDWQRAGLKLPSTVRVEKLATIEKSCVARKLGVLPSAELARIRQRLDGLFKQILG